MTSSRDGCAVSGRDPDALRRQFEWLELTLAGRDDAIVGIDADGRVAAWNDGAATLLGVSRTDAIGKPIAEAFAALDDASREAVVERVESTLRAAAVADLPLATKHPAVDGTPLRIAGRVTPVRDVGGEVGAAVLVLRPAPSSATADLQRALANSEARRSAAIAMALDGVLAVDDEGFVREMNPAAEAAFALAPGAGIGRSAATFLPGTPWQRPTDDTSDANAAVETFGIRSDGERFPAELTFARHDEGPIRFTICVRDVTERQRIEAAIHESERFTRSVLESSPDCTMVLDLGARLVSASGFCVLEIDDFTPYVQTTWAELWPEDKRDDANLAIATAHAGGRGRFECLLVSPKGNPKWWDVIVAPIRDNSGAVTGFVAVLRDITERHRADEALRETERRFRVMADAAPVLIWLSGTDKERTWFNSRWLDFVGCTLEQEISHGWTDHIHPEDVDVYLQTYRDAFDARRPFAIEFRMKRHDGDYRWLLDQGTPRLESDETFVGFIGSAIDITERKAAESAIGRLAAIVESSTDAIVSKGLDGVITSWNRSAERMFGYTAEEAIGKHIRLIIPADRADEEERVITEVRQGKWVDHFETERVAKDGRRLNVSLSISPVRDASGRTIGASKVARDVTDQKRNERALRESEERFRVLADNMSQFAWTADASGCVYWYNRRWYEYTGTTLEDVHGWGWTKVHHPDHVDRIVARAQHSWDTGEPFEEVFPLRGKDGTYRWFLSRALPIRDAAGNVIRWLGTNTDITEQRAAEDRLREVDQRKDEFLAMLAHELRGPLAPIRNSVAILRMSVDQSETTRSAIKIVDRQLRQMVRLVDDLLDVSRITRGKFELRREEVELSRIVDLAVEATRPAIESAGHELVVVAPEHPIRIVADPARLSQAIANLLGNACKYTPAGGTGRITLSVRLDRDSVEVAVEDNGVGIPPEDVERVFEMFTQVDRSLERAQGGLGIGLALCKRLVEMHGGNVTVTSEGHGKGSRFVLRLPLRAADGVDTAAEPMSSDGANAEATTSTVATSRRILVVDDNRDTADTLVRVLRLAGHETISAYDGVDAVETSVAFQPDVVLLDIGLPRMNGYDAALQIRRTDWGRRALIVALTGWGQEVDRQRSRSAGFDAHLVKPIDSDVLLRLIAGHDFDRVASPPPSVARIAVPAPTPIAKLVHDILNSLTYMQVVTSSIAQLRDSADELKELQATLRAEITSMAEMLGKVGAMWSAKESRSNATTRGE